jgi:hypothetical protein
MQLNARFQADVSWNCARGLCALAKEGDAEWHSHRPRPGGEAVKDGIRIRWKYGSGAELLNVEYIKTPFWINAARVNQRLSLEVQVMLGLESAARVFSSRNDRTPCTNSISVVNFSQLGPGWSKWSSVRLAAIRPHPQRRDYFLAHSDGFR